MFFSLNKKKFRFSVKLKLEGLSAVPYINGHFFAKVRLMKGGDFGVKCESKEVNVNHTVTWDEKFEFQCEMSADAATGVLHSCLLRISVRRELNGGRSFQKLGFVDLDLAEFAGAGLTCKRSLLDAYSNTHHRSDNSFLKVWIEMTLLSSDPVFKRPNRGNSSFYAALPDLDLGAKGTTDADSLTEDFTMLEMETRSMSHPPPGSLSLAMLTSGGGGPGLLGSSTSGGGGRGGGVTGLPAAPSTPSGRKDMGPAFDLGHSRNSSQQSKGSTGGHSSSGPGSLPAHSRQGSTEAKEAGLK